MTEEQAWVFDSLVCFLHGPVWNAPIQNFIEEKSIIFESNGLDENNIVYKRLHEEYKNLVDFMLGSFMEELQITTEQFEVACLENRMQNESTGIEEKTKERSFSFHQGLFQQIWAANDIRIFVKMMIKRNLELQIQALDLIERQQASSSSNQSDDKNFISQEQTNESLYNDGKVPDDDDVLRELNSSTQCNEKVLEKCEDDQVVEKFKRLNLFFVNEKIDTREVNQRQEYLRSQRDKILHIKKQARARQLNETMTERPQSASVAAAKILLDDEIKDRTKIDSDSESSTLRITLARRLKSEIIDAASEKND